MGTSAAKTMVGRQVAMGAVKDMVSSASSAPNINWENYNFPPCINLFHFTYGELEGNQHNVAKKIVIN